ncbi:PRC and DUF2382 domain-containing protein [Arthrobacter sp. TmT3-37]
MLTMNDLDPLLRHRSTVVTGEGDKVGTVGVVYLDDADDRPSWVTVHTGLFGTRESFVPLEGASVQGRDLVVAYPRDLIRHAPSVDRDGHLSPEDEAALYRHYGLRGAAPVPRFAAVEPATEHAAVRTTTPATEHATARTTTPATGSAVAGPATEHAAAEPATESAAARTTTPSAAAPGAATGEAAARAMHTAGTSDATPAPTTARTQGGTHTHDEGGTPWVVRSEERLRVGTEQYEAARVRLRKYIVTEEATMTVPLKREEIRIEVEPISSPVRLEAEGVPFQEQSVELVAHEELAVLSKETVPVERVSMRTVEVAGRTTVREEVRKERIASSADGAASVGRGRGLGSSNRGTTAGADADASTRIATNSTNALLKGRKKRR